MANLMAKRNWFFALSALIIIPGVISLLIFHLKLGIDFTGGSLLRYSFTQSVQAADVQQAFASVGITDVEVQTTIPSQGAQSAIVRAPNLNITQIESAETALKAKFGNVTRDSADTVGPLIGQQTTRNAIFAVIAASVIILLYIWWAFRRLEKPYRYGTCAIIALLHDVLVVVGLWSIFGKVFGFEVDALFVTGVLTVVGFSVHDTVVVFDRIRENLIKRELMVQEATKLNLDKSPDVLQEMDMAKQSVLINAYLSDYMKKNPISEDMLVQEYEARKAKLGDKEYNARHILVDTEAQAKTIIAQLGKKVKFEKLAAQSKDTGSAAQGGSLGWQVPSNFVAPFAQALQSLKKGEYTKEPVHTQFGWHVIRLDDERALKVPGFEEVKPQLQQHLQQQAIQKAIADLQAKAKVE